MNENTNYEKVKSEILKALEEANDIFSIIDSKETFVSMILSGAMQKFSGVPFMNYYTCKLLSDMGYYENIYEYVKARGGQYFDALTEEIEIKMKS